MDMDRFVHQMAHNAERIRALVQGIPDEQAPWKPDADSWSILEVINHLYDEERYDFRVRLDMTLHHPGEPWPAIDPEGWVSKRQYNQRELGQSLDDFLAARQESLDWLQGLSSPNWAAAKVARFGTITAGDLFASWIAHDLLHMRQLVELHWAHTMTQVTPHGVAYAGEW